MQKNFLSNSNQGFTLLEVIIAMAIMAIAFSAILAVEGGAINASARAKQLNVVAMLAKNQMVDSEALIEGKKFEEVQKEQEGAFPAPFQDYRWKRTVKELKFPNFASGALGNKNSGNDMMSDMVGKIITNFFSKALRVLTVTVYWKKGKGEQSYSLSTFWVDLNHELDLVNM